MNDGLLVLRLAVVKAQHLSQQPGAVGWALDAFQCPRGVGREQVALARWQGQQHAHLSCSVPWQGQKDHAAVAIDVVTLIKAQHRRMSELKVQPVLNALELGCQERRRPPLGCCLSLAQRGPDGCGREVLEEQQPQFVGNGGTLGEKTVRTVMDDHPMSCTPETELEQVRPMMLERHTRYMPVMDNKMLMGVISFYDVAKAVVDSQNFENQMLKAYIRDWPAEDDTKA